LFVGSVSAQELTSASTQEQLQDVERVERVVDKIYDIVDEKIPE
jgi:hypothetical protein